MVGELRARIVRGLYPPGGRLPPRVDLEREFGAGPVTVQRVFDRLIRDGFVVAQGRRGTFVSERPPHLFRYALVFPYRDGGTHPWPQFWRALAAEAATAARADGHELVFSYGNETHEDMEAYQALITEVSEIRVAGLLFASEPFYLYGSPLLTTPGVPRVALMATASIPGVKAVSLSGDLLQTMVARLAAAGRRRIAVIVDPAMEKIAEAALRDEGIQVPPGWIQLVQHAQPQGAWRSTQLLMSLPPRSRPDGLVVADDNLVEQASEGLVAAGVRVPRDVMVAVHCNFPHPTRCAVPALRVGYDVRALLRACLDVLARQRQGQKVPDVTRVPLVDTGTESTEIASAVA